MFWWWKVVLSFKFQILCLIKEIKLFHRTLPYYFSAVEVKYHDGPTNRSFCSVLFIAPSCWWHFHSLDLMVQLWWCLGVLMSWPLVLRSRYRIHIIMRLPADKPAKKPRKLALIPHFLSMTFKLLGGLPGTVAEWVKHLESCSQNVR